MKPVVEPPSRLLAVVSVRVPLPQGLADLDSDELLDAIRIRTQAFLDDMSHLDVVATATITTVAGGGYG